MKGFFNYSFKNKLIHSIQNIEKDSLIEVVVVIKRISGEYLHIPFLYGMISFILTFIWLVFSPVFYDFNLPLVYGIWLLSFFIGYLVGQVFSPLQRIFIKKASMQKNVELKARAIFQKSGMHHTQSKIGTLIYVSLFERKVFIIADSGAETAIPLTEWESINANFQTIFQSPNIEDEFLKVLQGCQPIFSKYLPTVKNKINELPDFIEIDI